MKTSITKNKISALSGGLFWILIWQVLALWINNVNLVPRVDTTLFALVTLSKDPTFTLAIIMTLMRVLVGFGLSCLAGLVLGFVSGLKAWVYHLLNPLVQVFKVTPVISVIIIVGLWVHSEYVPIVIAFLMCFPIVWTNIYHGVKETDRHLLDMAKCFHVSPKHILKDIYLPSLKPYVAAAVISSFGISWKVTVAAEVLSFPRFAIGKKLYESKIWIETTHVFAWTLVVILLSILIEWLIRLRLKRMIVKESA